MLPLHDENPSSSRPVITWALLAINVAVFVWQFLAGLDIYVLGAVPALVLSGRALHTLFTSIFLHGSLAHIFGNMLYLYIFGDNVEDRFGHLRFLFLYLFWGVAAGLAHSYLMVLSGGREALIPAIGASGSISGVLGAYLVLFPSARIVSVVAWFGFLRTVRVPAIFFLGFYFFILQFFYGIFDPFSSVAYWAHVGGFMAGFAVAVFYRLLRAIA